MSEQQHRASYLWDLADGCLQERFWKLQGLGGTGQCEPEGRRQAGSSDAACAGSGDSGFPSQCVPVLHF